MPPFRLLLSTVRRAYVITAILLLGKVILLYSRCVKKGLVYITIAAPSSHQPSFYSKCISVNIQLSYNIYSVSDIKCIYTCRISL